MLVMQAQNSSANLVKTLNLLIDIIGNKKYLPAKNAKRAKKGEIEEKPDLFALMIV